jgi:pre-mRNA-processing factor SLU7
VRSRYEEDVYPSNHTSVWGSYWEAGEWGYKCCRSLVQNSYCTGKSGIALSTNIPEIGKIAPVVGNDVPESIITLKNTVDGNESITSRGSLSSSSSDSDSKLKEKLKKKKKKKKKKKNKNKKKTNKEDIKDSLKKALEKEDERLKEVDRIMNMDERKRPYNSMYEVSKPTDDEIEAYHMKKRRDEDPMANFV